MLKGCIYSYYKCNKEPIQSTVFKINYLFQELCLCRHAMTTKTGVKAGADGCMARSLPFKLLLSRQLTV